MQTITISREQCDDAMFIEHFVSLSRYEPVLVITPDDIPQRSRYALLVDAACSEYPGEVLLFWRHRIPFKSKEHVWVPRKTLT